MKSLANKKLTFLVVSFLSIYAYVYIIWSYGLSLQDEGFLWYGAWQTSLGAMPFVDFQSYDPFRYFWVAAWFFLFDDHSIFTFRLATYSFAIIGLFLFLYMLNESRKKINTFESMIVIILFLCWLFPHWKIFEHTVSIASVFALYMLLKNDSNKNFVYVGLYTSFLFIVGKNHALYMHLSVVLFFVLYFFVHSYMLKLVFEKIKFFLFGYIIGLLPLGYMIFFVDGYLQKNIEWIEFLFNKGNTNLNKEFVFPWDITYDITFNGLQQIAFSFLTIYMIAFALMALFIIGYTIKTKKVENPLLVVSSIVAIFYFHYFSSRPDIAHMAQTIMPTLLLSFALIVLSRSKILKYTLSILLVCFTVLSSKSLLKIEYFYPNALVEYTITGHKIKMGKKQKDTIEFVQSNISGKDILVLPSLSTFYVLSDAKSSIYDLFLVFPKDYIYQENMVKQIQKNSLKYIIYEDKRWDGSDKLNFDKMYPIIYGYIMQNYHKINSFNNLHIYKVKENNNAVDRNNTI